jgi:DNA polymerase-1
MVDIIQMQLTGLPLNRQNVLNVRSEFSAIQDAAIQAMRETDIVQSFLHEYRLDWIAKQNLKLKTIQRTMDDAIKAVEFNPNSPVQLGSILYGDDFLALPIIERTKKGQPAAAKDTIKALLNHVTNEDHLQFMHALREFKEVNKMLTSFIPAMLEAPQGPDGWHYLFGSFNLGGTVSGRLSSSNPNLQNLPAKGKLAKLIKECFQAPEGWLFCGLDYASLEDRISALTTKDPNKLKVYTDGYDGHCLRAYSYFTDSMPDIDPTTVEGINAISSKYPDLRGNSKAPTFALTYQGTWRTLVKNCGFTPQLAQHLEAEYHKLYFVSDQWVEERIKQASQKGYIVGAFGLRVRTPLLARTVLGAKSTPYEAAAEGRTAGNALGQSWCLLNSRSSAAFMKRVRKSAYATDIRICAQIHDAAYFMIRALPDPIHFTNTHLVEEVNWNDHPDIYHPEVGLGGEFGIFYPSWAQEIVLPNGSTHNEIEKTINEIMCG